MPAHLTLFDRDQLAHLRSRGFSQREIARAIGRSLSTVSRELRRNRTGDQYYPGQAHLTAQRRRRERPIARKMDDPAISAAVRHGLGRDWSPEQIAGRMQREQPDEPRRRVSPQTIYAWIERDANRAHWKSRLRRRGKRPCRRKPAEKPAAARVANRPTIIEERRRFGDFEGDTVLGPAGKGGVATLVDRTSRFTIMVKIQSKDANHVHRKLKLRLKELDADHRRSITFDNGTEFARCHRLEKHLGMKLYYADPGCPYQRGTNENTNGLIRQYFPKGTNFQDVSHWNVREAEQLLNHRPRACLNFKTPVEVFFEQDPPSGCD